MVKDEQWPVARLIPISSASGVEAQERRAASALLAVITSVSEFGRALLKPLGAPSGRIETFIEVPFKIEGRSIRPDGIITVTRGSKTWGAIVETKTAATPLDPQQIDTYLDLARQLEFNAVLSISNQYVTSSAEYPVEVDRRKLKRVSLHHWSWIDVLTEAVVQKQHRGVSDPDQAYILGELIRYLSDPRSGALAFESMGSGWTAVREGARQHTLRKTTAEVSDVAARWDDLLRYLGLELTKDLGREVKQVLTKEERTPQARQNALTDSLAASGRLYAELQVPDSAGPLEVVADLRSRQVIVSTNIEAPREGRSKGRVSWLLRQLQNSPSTLKVESKIARSQASLATTLEEARQKPEALYPEAGKDIRQFVLTLTRNMGVKRDASKGSFIESVMSITTDFYADVLQNLRAWKAPPPKLKKQVEGEPREESAIELPELIEEALDQAEAEMAQEAGESPAEQG
ncbi:MAG: hypothetical protein M3343_12330 [Actinomycetota bacterium]|nr:hypothetical protein [Actinomycetota bacterium]